MVDPRADIAEVMRIAHLKGLTTGAGGNASIRTKEGMYITPSGKFKGRLRPEDIVFVSWEGSFEGKPSSEWRMHLSIYRSRPDVGAVLHCHHPLITGLANLTSEPFSDQDWTEEARILLKEVKIIDWRPYGTEELAYAVSAALSRGNAVIVRRHGPVTVARDIWTALSAMESLVEITTISLIRRGIRL